MNKRGFISLGLAAGVLAACAPLPTLAPTDLLISASIPRQLRDGLPPDAVLKLELADVSLADAPAIRIAQARLGPKDPLHLIVPRARLQAGRTHALSLRIEDAAGKLLWVSDTHNEVPVSPKQHIALGKLSMVRA